MSQAALDFYENNEPNASPSAFCLTTLDVFNWGPFSGFHHVDFDPNGSALIGQTGSGKTTLVDAFMTLITANPKYNLASTGGHESDRDLISYVRGKTGDGGVHSTTNIVRPDKTITGISTVLSNTAETVRLTAIFWLDSSSMSQSDMRRLFIFDKANGLDLKNHLELFQNIGSKGLKATLKEQEGVVFSENKKNYLAQIRRFFEVGDNAFTLLNRAAGLKQLNSIDTLFRELVLDDRSAFNRASEVINEFNELQGIHNELEIAKNQQQSLLPIIDSNKRYQTITEQLEKTQQQQKLLPIWFAMQSVRLWTEKKQQLETEINALDIDLKKLTTQCEQQKEKTDELYLSYQQLGGTSIEDLKSKIDEHQHLIILIKQKIEDYQLICKQVDFNPDISSTQLSQNQSDAEQKIQALDHQLQDLDKAGDKLAQKTVNAEEEALQLNTEIKKVKKSPNNIPGDYLDFQTLLSQQLSISTDDIPYIAQCVEVHDKPWQGAIERAIGSNRLRMIVPSKHMNNVLQWVNQRNNKLHIRLLNTENYLQEKTPSSDSFCHKLNYRKGSYEQVVRNFLASIDRHCVENEFELKHTVFGMTLEGLMSGKKGLFEKQDKYPIDQGWMTGFDNKSRLNELQNQFNKTSQDAIIFRKTLENHKQKKVDIEQLKLQLADLQQIDFSELDLTSAIDAEKQLQERLENLLNPESDTGRAEKRWKDAKEFLDQLQEQETDLKASIKYATKDQDNCDNQIKSNQQRITINLTTDQIQLIEEQCSKPTISELPELVDRERTDMRELQEQIEAFQKKLNTLNRDLVRLMSKAKNVDTGALVEVGTDLDDIPAYLERLDILIKEDLPSKLDRFKNYLNLSSDQGVTQLLTDIDYEVAKVEERIEELNQTLKQVDFEPGHFLQLKPQKVNHESVVALQKAQRHLRSAAMIDDDGESHFKALIVVIDCLKDAVERSKTQSALALLDPRYRLQFSVAIINRESKFEVNTRGGSQGGSGGEKEIFASYILTASLSYALCPTNRKQPLFGTVILDEAFSKSSQAVAARIIAALNKFGLHPLFVTPNKELRLLRAHTQSAVVVYRRNQMSMVNSVTWESVDKHLGKKL